MKHSTRWIIGISALLIVGTLAALTYAALPQKTTLTDDSNQTKPAGPSSSQAEPDEPDTRQYTSTNGATIELDGWPEDGVITTPLKITGRVPGNWSFEASFPIDIVYEGDIGLPGTVAQLQGEWMTTELVPFNAILTFDEDSLAGKEGAVIFRKANPSGLPENDDSLGIEVYFSKQ